MSKPDTKKDIDDSMKRSGADKIIKEMAALIRKAKSAKNGRFPK